MSDQLSKDRYMYVVDEHGIWQVALCLDSDMVVLVGDIQNSKQSLQSYHAWKNLPQPGETWNQWNIIEPPAGVYMWVRDPKYPDAYEVAWSMGKPGAVEVIVANDPSLSRFKEEQWQFIPEPVFKKNKRWGK